MLFHRQIKAEQARIFFQKPLFGTEVVQNGETLETFFRTIVSLTC
jgi:hypothetical protein